MTSIKAFIKRHPLLSYLMEGRVVIRIIPDLGNSLDPG